MPYVPSLPVSLTATDFDLLIDLILPDIGKERELLKKRYDDVGKLYELPDGQLIDLGSERFESSEILYEPELTGLEQKPLHAMVIDSISAYVSGSVLDCN